MPETVQRVPCAMTAARRRKAYPCGSHDMVPHVLRGPGERLPLVVIQQPAEGLGEGPAANRWAGGRQHGHLQQHGGDEVHGFQQLQVDVHVEGHLAPPLQFLLLRRLVLVPASVIQPAFRFLPGANSHPFPLMRTLASLRGGCCNPDVKACTRYQMRNHLTCSEPSAHVLTHRSEDTPPNPRHMNLPSELAVSPCDLSTHIGIFRCRWMHL